MKKEVVVSGAPQAEHILSQAIVSGGLIFVAGQVHSTPDGVLVEGSVEQKLAQIMKNIRAILKGASADIDDCIKVIIYVTDMAQMADINQHYPTYFNKPYPAREAVCVTALPLGATIEISVIAEAQA